MALQKIIPNLWFDREAFEAVRFYTNLFPDGRIISSVTLHDTPSRDTDIVTFELAGYTFMGINGGPHFTKNPSISFFVNFDPARDPHARERLDHLWGGLSQGGRILMPLQAYPFSSHYGWIQDRYDVSWQLILTDPEGEERPCIIPSLLFTGSVAGKAEEALRFHLETFPHSRLGSLVRYPEGMKHDVSATLMFSDYMLENQWFTAMDSGYPHGFQFTEGISLMVQCDTQQEIDVLWRRLSADADAEQCGWLKDRYGISWQIVPTSLGQLLETGNPAQVDRVTKAVLEMKKLDTALLHQAFDGD
ncbi:MAG: VOC family protein [Sphaerochaetaceae bacterium]|jgi:predicted 3-demethylubiquinone-9 3-methyltransferase (glyoxalase superfamily)|nr:VOC family protein [Sphaerochaetaceae bacterium]